MDAVEVLTETWPDFPTHNIPAGWLGAFKTVIAHTLFPGTDPIAYVPLVMVDANVKVTSVSPLSPFSVTLLVEPQVGLVQPVPPTTKPEF